ncbi:DUF5011 domain-containing protein [Hyalangium minutum]|uniref:DUF5011 domain-containing protein n=1 Tax=Hyalangium minutum TaxID=394096 RepID=UPI00069408C4|nr:DUF5011 domain-containing protein [Hyalangium minutum]
MYSLLSLCAVLAACGASQTGELEESLAPTNARTSAAALELSPASPVNPIPGVVQAEYQSAIAAGNGFYFVVWTGTSDILGVRINALDGTPLDASPISIATGAAQQTAPAVAFDGTHFLVVWEQGAGNTEHLIYGTRVRASDGAVIDTPFLISRIPYGRYGTFSQSRPAVAFDGTNFLVVWEGVSPISSIYDYVGGIQGIRVRASDGTVIESTRFVIGSPLGNESSSGVGARARVAYRDGNYLVTWAKNGTVLAARIEAQGGQLLDSSPLIVGSGSFPAVTARDGEFLVVWYGSSALKARQLNSTSGALLGSADILVGQFPVSAPEVTFDGQDYRILWEGVRGGMGLKFVASRLSTQGTVATSAEVELSNLTMGTGLERGGIAAVAPGRFLTSYYGPDASGMARTFLRRVTDLPECTTGELSLEIQGSAELVLECGSGTYSDAGALAFDGCGNPLTVHGYNTGNDSSGPGPNLSQEGTYSVSYAAWGTNGGQAFATRTVIVDDRTAPTLTLIGPAIMTHTCGSQWVDPGVQATDACYGNLTPQVWHTGEVNGWAVGTYTVTYTLTDSGGNSAPPVTRTVNVVNCPW